MPTMPPMMTRKMKAIMSCYYYYERRLVRVIEESEGDTQAQ
jgi:hypothetical protein